MRPMLALKSLLQKEQERSEEESSVGDALVLKKPTDLDLHCLPFSM